MLSIFDFLFLTIFLFFLIQGKYILALFPGIIFQEETQAKNTAHIHDLISQPQLEGERLNQ